MQMFVVKGTEPRCVVIRPSAMLASFCPLIIYAYDAVGFMRGVLRMSPPVC